MQSNLHSDHDPFDADTRPVLSHRQLQCLAWVEQGKSAADIGQIIGISGRTVEGHLAKACELLEVRTRIQAVVRARKLGLLSEEPGPSCPSLSPRSFGSHGRR